MGKTDATHTQSARSLPLSLSLSLKYLSILLTQNTCYFAPNPQVARCLELQMLEGGVELYIVKSREMYRALIDAEVRGVFGDLLFPPASQSLLFL